MVRQLEIYVRNIRGAVEAVLGPLPDREAPQWLPLPSALGLHGTLGRYQARVFHSLEPSFTVSPEQMKSQYLAGADNTGLTLVTDRGAADAALRSLPDHSARPLDGADGDWWMSAAGIRGGGAPGADKDGAAEGE